jgi:hypothetical protein
VLDAKIKVDKYLSGSGSSESDAAHPAIRLAMHYYELASLAWGARIADDYQDVGEIGRTLLADMACPEIKTEIAGIRSASDYIIGRHFGFQPPILWSCAASKIAEADKH